MNPETLVYGEQESGYLDYTNSDDDIVISGISGRLPECSNIEEFREKLMGGIDMVTEDERKWPKNFYGLPNRTGKIKDLESFDATFFGVHAKQANVMDPRIRMLLELTYESIIDAGLNPTEVRGSKTGVFIGLSDSDSDEYWTADSENITGYGLIGSCRAMFANRISYTFDFNGPGLAIDTACSSSLYAMHHAVTAMRTGQCDAAIVGGANLLLKPTTSLQLHRLGALSPDGACKSFDSSANGYVRSDGVVVIYLQKFRDAKRVYATVVNSKVNTDGYKDQDITYPNGDLQCKLMREVYEEVGIDPVDVGYVEAHGTGTKVGDPQEVNSIAKTFCANKDRKSPLLLGSVKSNMGHSEPASGLCSVAKVLIAMEYGVIPPNLHYKTPNTDIPALRNGSIKVVSEATPWNGGLVGINGFGFGGANAHVVLRSNPKPKILFPKSGLSKLIMVSGRTVEAVHDLLDKINTRKDDDEFISMIHSIHANNISGHMYRGYIVSNDREVIELHNDEERPVWYVFSGMGSQWPEIGRELMCLPTFDNSLRRSARVLKPYGFDLMDLIHNGTERIFDDVLNSLVSIVSTQVALVDLLNLLEIKPDGIIGHSIGEVSCAYADGCFTLEQTVLTAYWRGILLKENGLANNMGMAVVGLSWEEAKRRCPPGVFPACHNSTDLVSVSGPVESIDKFITELESENVFAKTINSSGVAFHSEYIAEVGPKLLTSLEKIISTPKQRSPRWISTSIPASAWNTRLAQFSSPAYHVNNLLSPVFFQEGFSYIPPNAIVIEIGPHCILQTILRRSLPTTVTNLGLCNKNHSNNTELLLTNLGKLYNSGLQPRIAKIYPPIRYPVGRGTPMINSMIKWDHSIRWDVPDFTRISSRSRESIVEIDLSKDSDKYLRRNTIDGRVSYPEAGYLTMVWKTLAKLKNLDFEKVSVVFKNVHFYRPTILSQEGSIKFSINIFEETGDFKISEGGSLAVTGKIFVAVKEKPQLQSLSPPCTDDQKGYLDLSSKDVYKELRLRGYEYDVKFQGIISSDNRATIGKLKWTDDWISFIVAMMQFGSLGKKSRDLRVPVILGQAIIDPVTHKRFVENIEAKDGLAVYAYPKIGLLESGGIALRGIKATLVPRKQQIQAPPKHEIYKFVPYLNSQLLDEDREISELQALTVLLQIVRENLANLKIRTVELTGTFDTVMAPMVLDVSHSLPLFYMDLKLLTNSPNNHDVDFLKNLGIQTLSKDPKSGPVDQNLHLVLATDVLTNDETCVLKNLAESLEMGGFIILKETGKIVLDAVKHLNLILVSKQIVLGKSYVLLKKVEEYYEPIVLKITEKKSSWLEDLKAALKKVENKHKKLLIVSQEKELLGSVGLMNCLRHEAGDTNLCYFFIQDDDAPSFSLTENFYTDQLNKQVIANVFKGGQWGSYRHLRIDQQTNEPLIFFEHAYVSTIVRGDLSSLSWIQSPLKYKHHDMFPEKEFCAVYYASLNLSDVILATGKHIADPLPGELNSQDYNLGLEFSGRNSKGHRVMGMVPARGLATTVLAEPEFLWEVPDKWTLEEAATIPLVYATSYYSLCVSGNLKPGESVLIHSGSSGVGQASISIALHMGCKVFTTVSSLEKREFLTKIFPQLKDDSIGNYHDASFEQMLMTETDGCGVDVILNSVTGKDLEDSVRCLASAGRFLEIGKNEPSGPIGLDMSTFMQNNFFHGVYVGTLFHIDSSNKKQLIRLVSEGIKNGAVRPLPTIVFNEHQIEQAFRYMSTVPIKKVLVKIRNEESKNPTLPYPKTVGCIPRTYFDPGKSYVLVGGLGGFGLELTNWMISRGAQYIVLNSRSGVSTGYQSLCLRKWREICKVKVFISTEDVTTSAGADNIIKWANEIAPVGGIFNLAAVLKDALIQNLEKKDFEVVTLPKINGTKYLDIASRILCPALDYFVVFSSISCGRGIAGQTNYGMANSAVEKICEQRRSLGFPGMAIQWGAIGDVGLFIETNGDNESELNGVLPQRISSCLKTMDKFLRLQHPVLASMVIQDEREPAETQNRMGLVETVGKILGIKDLKTIHPNTSFADLGVDSLMGTEIKYALERNFDILLNYMEILRLTFGRLQEFIAEKESSAAESPPK